MDGASVLAKALADQGIKYMFGIVGIPVMEVAYAAQQIGIKYIGMRNEQAASYAASAIGYLTGRPAVCLVVSGPGLVHALAGMANSKENCWPLIVIGGSSDRNQEQMGAFQELPQVEAARPYCKFAARPDSIEDFPFYVEKAVRTSIQGRQGVSYIDLPGEMIRGMVNDEANIRWMLKTPPPIRPCASDESIKTALGLLSTAKKPLIIIGKGAAQSGAEHVLTEFVNKTSVPFLPTPMGKGVVSDLHPLCVSAARSSALSKADVILLVCARLNWMLHFGLPPRFNKNVQIIQIDILPEEHCNNVRSCVSLCGDAKAVTQQKFEKGLGDEASNQTKRFTASKPKLLEEYNKNTDSYNFQIKRPWVDELYKKRDENKKKTEVMITSSGVSMNFYKMYDEINKFLPDDCIIVNEGANTMDIGRTMLMNRSPRHRLDAGTFGTMGVGSGFAIAAALVQQDDAIANKTPTKKVVCIQGDSAFGFAGMELETAVRYQLPIVFVIANNNGIYNGMDLDTWNETIKETAPDALPLVLPPVSLNSATQYEKIMHAFNCHGYNVCSASELQESLKMALKETRKPSLVHVHVESTSQRKAQEFDWLTRSKL